MPAPRTAAPPPAPRADDSRAAAARRHWRRTRVLTAGLLAAWVGVAFVLPWFARDLDADVLGWPLGFWIAAQGAAIAFLVLIAAYARGMARLDAWLRRERRPPASRSAE